MGHLLCVCGWLLILFIPHLGVLVLYEVDSTHRAGIFFPPFLLAHVQVNILKALIHLRKRKCFK